MAEIINLFVDDHFGTGGNEMEQRVLARLRKDFRVGSEDWNDVLLTGQRICWMKHPQLGPSIEVSQERAIEELEVIPVEKKTQKKISTVPMQGIQSLLEQINCLRSRTHFKCFNKFSGCASKAASPTIGDVKAPNKLARQLKSLPVKLQFLPQKTFENVWIS